MCIKPRTSVRWVSLAHKCFASLLQFTLCTPGSPFLMPFMTSVHSRDKKSLWQTAYVSSSLQEDIVRISLLWGSPTLLLAVFPQVLSDLAYWELPGSWGPLLSCFQMLKLQAVCQTLLYLGSLVLPGFHSLSVPSIPCHCGPLSLLHLR